MDSEMDIDMDLDFDPLPEEGLVEEGEAPPEIINTEANTDIPLAYTDQTLDIQPNKVHIRGLDEATTDEVREFSKAHFHLEEPTRIEWIDDTSANIIYRTNEFASKALEAFTLDLSKPAIAADPVALRLAKSMPSQQDSMLQVRPALFSDKKKPRAHEASRFYLMHPTHDPRERMRIERRRGGRGGDENGDYNRRRYDDRENRRRRDKDAGDTGGSEFTASMYDDDVGEVDTNAEGRGRDLFSRTTRARRRSASPGGYSSSSSTNSRSRFRSRNSPPRPRRDKNAEKELFPVSGSGDTNGGSLLQRERDAPPKRELFPQAVKINKSIAKNLKRDLFPHKTSISNHRRTDAVDAAADEAADLFDRKLSAPFTDGARELFPDSEESGGMNIRGSAGISIKGGAGISIKGRGGGAGTTEAKQVKELFPARYNEGRNQGKELFSDKLEGRGGTRRRAEDMFG